MKRILVLISVISFCLTCSAQNYFSTFLNGEDYVYKGGITQFNNRTIIAASESCNGPADISCTYLLELNGDNSISYLFDVGELQLFSKSISSNDSLLAIVGLDENNSIKLFQFDDSLALVNETTYAISSPGSSWIFNMIEYSGHYVVAEYRIGTSGENYPTLYWFDVNDLNIQGTYTIEEDETVLKELAIDENGNLKLFKSKHGRHEILTFNSDMELIEETPIQESGRISYFNFDITSDGSVVFGLLQQQKLISYDFQGEFRWELDIAEAFGVPELQIRELKQVSDGDILLCGSLKKNNINYGFIYLLNNSGKEQWKRIYKPNNSTRSNPLKGFIEVENEGFIFYGATRFEAPTFNFHDTHWVLKTNYNGCIDEDCGDEIIISSIEIERSHSAMYPNPTNSTINLIETKKELNQSFVISNLQGKLISNGPITDNSINLKSLESGVYFISIYTSGQLKYTEKVIKD